MLNIGPTTYCYPFAPSACDAQLCFETCAAESALYFVLFKGSMCACGHDEAFLTKEAEIGYCDTPCAGDSAELCGGDYEYDLFELFENAGMPSPVAVSSTADPTPHGKY